MVRIFDIDESLGISLEANMLIICPECCNNYFYIIEALEKAVAATAFFYVKIHSSVSPYKIPESIP